MHIASLARLGVPEEQVPALVAELNTILGHMAVLAAADVARAEPAAAAGELPLPLREDRGPQLPLARPLDQIAPVWRDGFFLVPRLATHEDPGADESG